MNNDFESGVMLDMGRKYFSPEQIKRLISELKKLECNSLMLHFSEDMGLGLECPDFPWLAGRSGDLCPARNQVGGEPDGGVVTVEELKEIIRFAEENGIEIIPSYDSPGHLNYTVRKFNEYVVEKGSISFSEGGNEYSAKYDGEYFSFFKNGEDLKYSKETAGKYGIFSYYLTDGVNGIVKGTMNEECARGMDLCNEVGVAFIRATLASYAKLFFDCGCRKIDLGGDEMLGFGEALVDLKQLTRWQQLDHWKAAAIKATGMETAVAYDLMVLYMNGLCRMVKDMGYTSVRFWNDEFRRTFDTGWNTNPCEHVQFDKDVKIQYWSGRPQYESPASLADSGYELINCDSTYCYFVLLKDARKPNPSLFAYVTEELIKKEWTPYGVGKVTESGLPDGWYLDTENRRKALRGAYFCVWCDDPNVMTDGEAIDGLIPFLKAWKSKL